MKNILRDYIIILTSLVSATICLFPTKEITSGYELLWIQPLTFSIVYLVILRDTLNKGRFLITLYSYLILSMIRMVIIPLFSSLSGLYNGVSYIYSSMDSIQLAVFLVVYEFIITSIFLSLITNSKNNKYYGKSIDNGNLHLEGSKVIYGLFIFMALGLYVLIGRNLNLIQFFVMSTDSAERYGDVTSTYLVLLRQLFKGSLIFLFTWFTSFCQKKYNFTKKNKYVYYAILLGILNVGVIVGERRSEQIYTSLVVIFILIKVFKEHRKMIVTTILSTALTVLLFMSIYKHFAASAYGSYTEAMQASTMDLNFFTETLQSYFFGTQNVAVVIEMKKHLDLDILNMLYDFGRSIFGFSFILKNKMVMTTEYFNTFIYGVTKANGHVISGVGYGYYYLGSLLAPLIVCLNIYISIKLEKKFNNTDSYEMKYILGYMLLRFTTNIFVNTPPLISLSTIMFGTVGFVYFVAKLFNSNKRTSKINQVEKQLI